MFIFIVTSHVFFVSVFRISLQQVNLLCVVGASFILVRHNIPIYSHRLLALPAPLMIKTRSRAYKRAREGGEAPMSLIVVLVYREWSPS
jgi:hypothetical protein